LPEGLAILAGRPKFGKSFLSLQLAIAVATGEGKKFGLSAVEAGDVLDCSLEDSERRLRCEFRRKRAGYSDAKRATIPTLKWATVPT
jgi:RecA-family ATPase